MPKKLLLWLLLAIVVLLGRPTPAKADATCYTGSLSAWQAAVIGQLYFYPLCSATGAMVVNATFSGSVVSSYPYSGTTNGQTASTASFLGVGGLYNSSAPTLTNGQYVPFQTDSSGNLLVNVKAGGGGTTFPYSGATSGQTATTASFVGTGGIYNSSSPSLTNGQYAPFQIDVNGNVLVSLKTQIPAGTNSIGYVNPDNNSTGHSIANGTLNAAVTTTVLQNFQASTTFEIVGTAGGVVYTFEAYNDAAPTWKSINCYNKANGTVSSTASSDGQYTCDSNGETEVRVRVSTTGSGNATVSWTASSSANQIVTIPSPAAQNFPTPQPFATSAGNLLNVNITNSPAPYVAIGVNPSGTPTPAAFDASNNLKVLDAYTPTTLYTLTAITTNTANSICSSACYGYEISAYNGTASACFVQEFNVAAGSVTAGSTAPTRVFLVPTTGFAADSLSITRGANFSTAWSYVATTTPTGATACGSTVYVQAQHS